MKTDLPKLFRSFLIQYQNTLCSALEAEDTSGEFLEESWKRPEGGGGITRIFKRGHVFETLGVNFSHIYGNTLPPSASAHRPELAGCSFEAMGVSTVAHPHNPYVPTAHMNIRLFCATTKANELIWWFGGGFDMTPYYAFKEDAIHFHSMALKACQKANVNRYSEFKKAADDYFFLKHRNEPRGIGGIFFDDYNTGDPQADYHFLQAVGLGYIDAYLPIVRKRKQTPFGQRERDFQLYRRGRYVEFNLIYDRGTLFGLQSGGRTESILMSLPNNVRWEYNWHPEPCTPENDLYEKFLKPTNWVEGLKEA